MAVEKPSAEYRKFEPLWKKCRDVDAGQDAMHEAGHLYIPQLKEQLTADYLAYVRRGPFFNATGRAVAGLVGMLFRQPPVVEVPPSIKDYLDDITMSGKSALKLAEEMSKEEVLMGRSGLLVDYPVAPIEGATLADAIALNLRPTIHLYKAESIIDARWSRVANATVLTMVRLKESVALPGDNEFEEKFEDRYRVLDLSNGVYRVRIYKVDKPTGSNMANVDVLLNEFTPLMAGKPLNFIPFEIEQDIEEPPLLDLVNMNISHYMTMVDYEHGCHFTGLPQAWIAGHSMEIPGEKLSVGGPTAWVFPNPAAKAEYLSLQHDFVALAANLTRKENQMAILGARMLEPQRRGVEAPETAAIHRKSEESALSDLAQEISTRFARALQWFSDWAGASGEVTFEVNRDFYPTAMTPQQLTALVAGWQAGAFSDQVLFDNLQQGDIIDSDMTLEEEQARMANQAPKLQGQAVGQDGNPIAPAPLKAAQQPGQTIVIQLPKGSGKRTVTGPGGQKYVIEEAA